MAKRYTKEELDKIHQEERDEWERRHQEILRMRRAKEAANDKHSSAYSLAKKAAEAVAIPFDAAYEAQKKVEKVVKPAAEHVAGKVKEGATIVKERLEAILPKNRKVKRDPNSSTLVREPTAEEKAAREKQEAEFETKY